MRRIAILMLVAGMTFLLPAASAQESGKSVDVGWVYEIAPKPGMAKQMEEGRKRHMDWHRKQNDTWAWEVWQIETGEQTGKYLSTTFGHTWQELDAWEQKMQPADNADSAINMTPYIGAETGSIWMVLKDASRAPVGNQPPKLAEISHFLLKPGKEGDFHSAIAKMNEAIANSDWKAHYIWYALQDGGEGPHYVLFYAMNGWADLAEPNPSFSTVLERALGSHDAGEVMHFFNDCIKREWTESIRFRPDLSYIPAPK